MSSELSKLTLPNGLVVSGTPVMVSESTERWSEFKLDDGTVVRAKVTMIDAFRVDGEFDEHGQPVYYLQHTVTAALASPQGKFRKRL